MDICISLVNETILYHEECIWKQHSLHYDQKVYLFLLACRLHYLHAESMNSATSGSIPHVSGGQISTKHLKTSIRPFFATCRLPQNPEFWRCYRPRHTWLSWVLEVLPTQHPTATSTSQNVAVVLNIFFLGVYMFFIWGILYDFLLWRHMVRRWELMVNEPKQETWELPRPP